jgi:hypothetical protein
MFYSLGRLYLPDDEFSIHSYDHGDQLAGRDNRL